MVAGGLGVSRLKRAGGSALTNKRRPSSLVTEAICALTGTAKRIAPSKVAENTAAFRTTLALGLRWFRHGEGIDIAIRLRVQGSRVGARPCDEFHSCEAVPANKLCGMHHLRVTVLALERIIAMVPAGRERSARHFLGQLCLYRQLRPGPVVRLRSRPPAWLTPVSACRHGL